MDCNPVQFPQRFDNVRRSPLRRGAWIATFLGSCSLPAAQVALLFGGERGLQHLSSLLAWVVRSVALLFGGERGLQLGCPAQRLAGVEVALLFGGERGLQHGLAADQGVQLRRSPLRRGAWIATSERARPTARRARRSPLRRGAWIATSARQDGHHDVQLDELAARLEELLPQNLPRLRQ